MNSEKVIIYHESLLRSVVSDAFTFALILLCLWASKGSTGWTFISGVMLLCFLCAKSTSLINRDVITCRSIDEVQAWVDRERSEMKAEAVE